MINKFFGAVNLTILNHHLGWPRLRSQYFDQIIRCHKCFNLKCYSCRWLEDEVNCNQLQDIHFLKLTCSPHRPKPKKERIVFQPSIFRCNLGVSKNNGTPKSSILIGFSIIFTIHFGGKIPSIWKHPFVSFREGKLNLKIQPGTSSTAWQCEDRKSSVIPSLGRLRNQGSPGFSERIPFWNLLVIFVGLQVNLNFIQIWWGFKKIQKTLAFSKLSTNIWTTCLQFFLGFIDHLSFTIPTKNPSRSSIGTSLDPQQRLWILRLQASICVVGFSKGPFFSYTFRLLFRLPAPGSWSVGAFVLESFWDGDSFFKWPSTCYQEINQIFREASPSSSPSPSKDDLIRNQLVMYMYQVNIRNYTMKF